ncbi:hypothetical protein [Silvanigrella aquatica]|uniref:Uncharacterized protein n=1 Tax=Silvanigrella aquatica TaxID=1915309 RepID=A0A1L4D3J6_9BACT|nr:hypothetical protein [Silvanigrella aquatica]APJ04784.1 hypothetical protein AXG55_13105 [Silvanigrella aquatica]
MTLNFYSFNYIIMIFVIFFFQNVEAVESLEDYSVAAPYFKKNSNNNLYVINNRNSNFYISPRIGVDAITKKSGGYFLSMGAEAVWIPLTAYDGIFTTEVGAKFISSVDKVSQSSINKVRSFYGFLGVGTSVKKNIVTGIRLLIGNEWIELESSDSSAQNQLGMGGEVKIGYEWENKYSLFASYGLTQNIQMTGINFAIML